MLCDHMGRVSEEGSFAFCCPGQFIMHYGPTAYDGFSDCENETRCGRASVIAEAAFNGLSRNGFVAVDLPSYLSSAEMLTQRLLLAV